MPVDMSRYPADWAEIRQSIMQRANWHCEDCGVPDGAQGWRDECGEFQTAPRHFSARFGWWDEQRDSFHPDTNDAETRLRLKRTARLLGWRRIITIVLTTAHLGVPKPDGTPGDKHDKKDCRPENLAALCQKCHLTIDRAEHRQNAARNRRWWQVQAGQAELF